METLKMTEVQVNALPYYTEVNKLKVGDLAQHPWGKFKSSVVKVIDIEYSSITQATIIWSFLSDNHIYATVVQFGQQYWGGGKKWYKTSENHIGKK